MTKTSESIALRSKSEIVESLPKAIKQSDKDHVRKIYTCHGNLVKNGYPNENNPATWIGWGRLESGDIVRIEAETREGKSGKKSLALKLVTIPNAQAVEMDLDEAKIPDYISNESKDFLDQ